MLFPNIKEQIDKKAYYASQQRGKGFDDIRIYKRQQRGGNIWNLAKRYAYPMGRFLLRKSMPIIRDIYSDVKPGFELAVSNVKKRARKAFGGEGRGRKKRKRRVKGRGLKSVPQTGSRRRRRRKKGSRKRAVKIVGGRRRLRRKIVGSKKKKSSPKITDIFK